MKTLQRSVAILATGVLALGGLAACGKAKGGATSSKDPRVALAASFKKFGEAASSSITLHFDDPKGTLKAALKKDSTDAGEKALIDRVLSGSIRITTSGKDLAKKQAGNFELELIESGKTDVAIYYVSKDVYVHVDQGFLTEVGGPDVVAQIKNFVPALATGGTVKIAGAEATDAFKTFSEQASGGKPIPTPSINPQALASSISAAVNSAVTVTKSGGGSYSVTVSLKPLATAVISAVKPIVGTIAEAAGGFDQVEEQAAKIPDGTISGTITTSDGNLSGIGIDLESIVKYAIAADPANAEDAPDLTGSQMLLSFDTSASAISAPSGATTLNLLNLISKAFGASSSSSSSGSGYLPPCSALPAGVTIPCSK